MNPPQTSVFPEKDAIPVVASISIHQINEFPEASSTEDTIAEEMSDASLDGAVDGNPSTSSGAPQLASFEMLNAPSSSSAAVAQRNDEGNDRKKDHKKRSKNWSMLETLKLIKARADLDRRFRSSGRKAVLWDEIAWSLQKADVSRDGQQCKDKWEKLTAGYREVREGSRDKEDLLFYKELHQIFDFREESGEPRGVKEDGREAMKGNDHREPGCMEAGVHAPMQEVNFEKVESSPWRKRKRDLECIDMAVVQELLEIILSTQQQLFKELLDAVDKRERIREQIRQEREEIWRAEERAQRFAFNNTMVLLTQKLLEMRPPPPPGGAMAVAVPMPTTSLPSASALNGLHYSKKRSKNWKRTEVFQLIRFRKEMEIKFVKSSRRAGLWEELGVRLASLGIKRDGKQCREKWDKLMAGYKDVIDGRREKEESPYFAELSSYMDTIKDLKDSMILDASKVEA